MRAIGLFLLLVGCLVLLWPWYGHLFRFHIPRGDAQFYGGAALLAGIAILVIARMRAR